MPSDNFTPGSRKFLPERLSTTHSTLLLFHIYSAAFSPTATLLLKRSPSYSEHYVNLRVHRQVFLASWPSLGHFSPRSSGAVKRPEPLHHSERLAHHSWYVQNLLLSNSISAPPSTYISAYILQQCCFNDELGAREPQ